MKDFTLGILIFLIMWLLYVAVPIAATSLIVWEMPTFNFFTRVWIVIAAFFALYATVVITAPRDFE